MFTKVNNFFVRVLLRLLLSLHLLESFRGQLNDMLGYYRLFRSDCVLSTSDLSSANLLQECFDGVSEPCEIEILFPEGYKPIVSLRCFAFCRLSLPGLSSNTYDILPGERFSISFIVD